MDFIGIYFPSPNLLEMIMIFKDNKPSSISGGRSNINSYWHSSVLLTNILYSYIFGKILHYSRLKPKNQKRQK